MWQLYYFAQGLIEDSPLPKVDADKDQLDNIFNLVYITIGAIGFFLIVLAGFRYVMAQGDPQRIASAKTMLVYTLIGIVVAGSAAAIVQYVMGTLD